jgi:hypothetical protein
MVSVRSSGTSTSFATAAWTHIVSGSPAAVVVAIGLVESCRDADVDAAIIASTCGHAATNPDSQH